MQEQQPPCSRLAALPLLEFIPAASPWLTAPTWFRPYAERLEPRAEERTGAGHRVCLAAPPQHGKTVVAEHAIARDLIGTQLRNGYVTYAAERAEEVAYNVRQIGRQVGVEFTGPLSMLRGPRGGSCKFIGIGGSITGAPIDGKLILDDLIKNRREAESSTTREHVHREVHGVLLRRLHMGADAIMMATRWHPDDPSGREIKAGWEYINLRAIADLDDPLGRAPGEPLAPVRFTLAALEAMRLEMGEYEWAAQYQGNPRPRGGEVFGGNVARFTDLPQGVPFVTAYGVDLAYTKSTASDRSVCIRMQRCGDVVYVTAARVAQVAAPEFTLTLKAMVSEIPGWIRWYTGGGGEKGSAQFIAQRVPNFRAIHATADKFVRAMPVAAAWNAGKIALPAEDSPYYGTWVEPLIDIVCSFTGVNDKRDDEVDALAAGWDELNPKRRERSVSVPGGNDRHDRTVY